VQSHLRNLQPGSLLRVTIKQPQAWMKSSPTGQSDSDSMAKLMYLQCDIHQQSGAVTKIWRQC